MSLKHNQLVVYLIQILFSVNKNREKGGEGVNYSTIEDDGSLVVDLTNAEIMLRERGGTSKLDVDRSSNLNLSYNLKRNTDYLIRSTVEEGNTNESQSTLLGLIWEV